MTKKLLLLLFIFGFTAAFSQNNYLDFDGANDNVDIINSGNAVASATAITLSCKVFPKSTTAGFQTLMVLLVTETKHLLIFI